MRSDPAAPPAPTRPSRARLPLVAATAVALAACAEPTTGTPASDGPQRYTVTTTVLESPEHGPQLCLGGVAESLPPQCGGPDVVGFDWAEAEGEQSAGGTTWGEFFLTGTWDGERFTLTEPPADPSSAPPPPDALEPDLSTPCPPPEGGWAVVAPSRATEEDLHAAIEFARAQPTHGGAWLDQLAPPEEPVREGRFDPAEVVLNLRATDDLDALEGRVRELWGGPLCVVPAERTLEELQAVQQEVWQELDGALGSGIDEVRGVVEVTVPVADEQVRSRVADRFPGDVVELHGRLQPVS